MLTQVEEDSYFVDVISQFAFLNDRVFMPKDIWINYLNLYIFKIRSQFINLNLECSIDKIQFITTYSIRILLIKKLAPKFLKILI